MFGGVHAPADGRRELLDAWLAQAEADRLRVLAVQIRADQVPLFEAHGFTVNRFGCSYGLRLADFSYRGTPKMKLRNKIKRARAAGLDVLEVGVSLPRTPETFAALEAISQAWLAAKRKKEIAFMVGELGGPEHTERRIFVARDTTQRCIGFITYVPVWGRHPGYLHDLTRRRPDAPPGTMEVINATALDQFRDEGVPHLHFGFTPFITDGPEPASASRLLTRAIGLLARHGRSIYPADAQVRYKRKWGPQIIEPEYLAGRPFSARGVFDLLRLTRSL